MYCRYCGAYNKDKAKFCGKCGNKITSVNIENKKEIHKDMQKMQKGKTKKSVVIIGIVGFTFLIVAGAFLLTYLKNKSTESDEDAIKNYCVQYASDYEIIDNSNNSEIQINVTAPDFSSIVAILAEENREITLRELEKTVEEHSELKKNYNFSVKSEKADDIENAFIEEVLYDLMVNAISNTEYAE